MKHGLLDAGDYRPAIDKGWAALTRAVAKDGRLGWVQQVSDRPESVAETDTQYYGVGAFLLAASAHRRSFERREALNGPALRSDLAALQLLHGVVGRARRQRHVGERRILRR